jgi:uncharacterized OsmC-like protein
MSTTTAAPSKLVYRAHIADIEPRPGMIKTLRIPGEAKPVLMGMHGNLAKFFKLADGSFEPQASTLDYVIAAAAACMTGVLGKALSVREIPIADGRLKTEAFGDVETNEDGILVIRRIKLIAHVKADTAKRDAVERIMGAFHKNCPVYQSIHKAIDITTELDFQPITA